jgi:pseudaminic acid biosynthesis-associated methylase
LTFNNNLNQIEKQVFAGGVFMEETAQMEFWKGKFGDDYISRNDGDFDELYKSMFGITRTALNGEFLSDLNKESRILEVGCNIGKQLSVLQNAGYSNLWGVEINDSALRLAKENKEWNLVAASGFDIPFKDGFFDVVFTSGVLIHIAPEDLEKFLDEMYRTSKKYIWCFEYFSEECEEIEYRNHKNRLWKNNFLKLFMDRFPDLKLVKERKIPHLGSENVDMMFLLEKK